MPILPQVDMVPWGLPAALGEIGEGRESLLSTSLVHLLVTYPNGNEVALRRTTRALA